MEQQRDGDIFVEEIQERFNEKILELCIAKTFAKIKEETVKNEESFDSDEVKKQKNARLLGMTKWGLSLQCDLDNMKRGESFDAQSQVTQQLVNSEMERLLQRNGSLSGILEGVMLELNIAKEYLRT